MLSLFVSNGPFAFAHPHFLGRSIFSAFAADGDPPGRLEFYYGGTNLWSKLQRWEKNENERLAAPCLSLERNHCCGWLARSLMRWSQWWIDEKVVTEERTKKEHSARRPGQRALTHAWALITEVCLERLCLLTMLLWIDLSAISVTRFQLFSIYFCSRAEGKRQCRHFRCSLITHTHTHTNTPTRSPVSARC